MGRLELKGSVTPAVLAALSIWIAGCGGFRQEMESEFLCDCSKVGLDPVWADSADVSCFQVPVLRNVKASNSGKHLLAVVVAGSISSTDQLPLLYLHGGPGIATIENVKRYLKAPTWKLLREQRDLIFFDYRGTGFSEPEICDDILDSLKAFSSANPTSVEISARENALYRNCRETLLSKGISLADFTSFQLAADAEEIRKALEIKDWNVYGVSYGTTVALNLLRSFPSSIRSVILDSPYPPNAPWIDFVRPFDACFSVLESSLASDPVNAKIFPSIRTDYVNAVRRLNETPAELSVENDGIKTSYKYTGDDFAWSVWSAMLSPKSIPYVPLAIQEIASGNDMILQQWSAAFSSPDEHGKFSEAQSHAILCYEARPQTFEDTEESLTVAYPDFISFNSGYNKPLCDVWRPEIATEDVFQAVVSDIPVLILSGEFDPVCPPIFGAVTAKTLSRSTLIVVPAASHAAIHADDCLRKIAYDFISNPELKIVIECAYDRKKIEFVTSDLLRALEDY